MVRFGTQRGEKGSGALRMAQMCPCRCVLKAAGYGLVPCHFPSVAEFKKKQQFQMEYVPGQSKLSHSSSFLVKEKQTNSFWFWSNKRLSPGFFSSIVSLWNNYCEITHLKKSFWKCQSRIFWFLKGWQQFVFFWQKCSHSGQFVLGHALLVWLFFFFMAIFFLPFYLLGGTFSSEGHLTLHKLFSKAAMEEGSSLHRSPTICLIPSHRTGDRFYAYSHSTSANE